MRRASRNGGHRRLTGMPRCQSLCPAQNAGGYKTGMRNANIAGTFQAVIRSRQSPRKRRAQTQTRRPYTRYKKLA